MPIQDSKIEGSLLREFYAYVARELPDGRLGQENGIPLQIGGNDVYAIVFGLNPADAKVSFGLFVRNPKPCHERQISAAQDGGVPFWGRYARKTLLVDATGELSEERPREIPYHDQLANEPDFSGVSNQEIAFEVVREVLSPKRAETE